jgi:hypothetical protein
MMRVRPPGPPALGLVEPANIRTGDLYTFGWSCVKPAINWQRAIPAWAQSIVWTRAAVLYGGVDTRDVARAPVWPLRLALLNHANIRMGSLHIRLDPVEASNKVSQLPSDVIILGSILV